MTELETPRLKLRQWCAADLEPFASLNADPVVIEFLSRCLTRAESDEFGERVRSELAQRGWGLWAVEVREQGEFIGFVGLSEPSFEAHFTPCTEIGWRLARSGRLAHRERDVHEVRAPHHLESKRGAGRHAAQAPVERIDAVDRLIVHGDDQIAGAQIRLRGRPLRLA